MSIKCLPSPAPFSCLYNGKWYREREEFYEGFEDCSICLCINTVVKCNDESCPRSTTPLPTTTFSPGPIGTIGSEGDLGAKGDKGSQGDSGTPGIPGNPGSVEC